MNTQDLASRIVDQVTRAVLGSPLLDEPQRSVLIRNVKRKLDRALAEDLVRTQNNHPVKVPAVPVPRQSWIEDMAKSCAWNSMPLNDSSPCRGCPNEGIVGCKCPLGEYDGE